MPATAWQSWNLLGAVNDDGAGFHPAPYKSAPAVTKIAKASAALGAVLPIAGPAANSSWVSEFYGPVLRCQQVNDTFKNDIDLHIMATTRGLFDRYPYLSWFPDMNGSLPLVNASTYANVTDFYDLPPDYSYHLRNSPIGPSFVPDQGHKGKDYSGDTATLYVGSWPNIMRNAGDMPGVSDRSETVSDIYGWSPDLSGSVVVSCQLWNVSYSAEFNYTNGEQHVTLQENTDILANPVKTLAGFTRVRWEPLASLLELTSSSLVTC